MSLLRNITSGLRSLFRKEQVSQELDEELNGFLELAAEEKMKQGMSRKDALRAVRLERGSLEATKEVVRSAGWESFVETLWQDLRFAGRILRKNPGFTAVAVLTLALGIGANTAIFNLVDTFLLRVLPVKDPQQLVFIRATRPKGGTHSDFSYATFWGGSLLLAVLSGRGSTIPFQFSPNPRALTFTASVSLLAGVLFGLAPALACTRVELNPVLKGAGGHSGARATHGRLTKSLAISQVALSLSLLIGAGLLLRALQQFYAVDTGFERENIVQGWVFPALEGYDRPTEMRLYRELLEKFNATPGVQSASLSRLRMIFGNWYRDAWAQGAAVDVAETRQVYCDPVGPRFFATMGIPLLLGREFSAADTETSPKVAIISESLARKFFPNVNPLGRRFGFDSAQSSGDIEVIGVVKDVRHHLEDQRLPEAAWIPYTQATTEMYGQMNFLVRTATDPASVIPALREQARSVDKSLPLVGVETQEAEVDEYLGDQRSMAMLLSFFAALALALAMIGLYGTMSYAVGRRTRELGIRFALGAQRGEVLRMVLRETMSLAAIGVAIGVPVALAAARLLSSMLFGVKTTDAATVSTAILVMCATALLAGYLPARRAMRVDPMVALRYE